DGGGHQRSQSALSDFRPKLVARFLSQAHASNHKLGCLRLTQTAAGKAGKTRLVAGAGGNIGAGTKIIQMDLPDQGWAIKQHPGRPQGIVQVCPAPFQLGSQGAVQDDDAGLIEKGLKGIDHTFSACGLALLLAYARRSIQQSLYLLIVETV